MNFLSLIFIAIIRYMNLNLSWIIKKLGMCTPFSFLSLLCGDVQEVVEEEKKLNREQSIIDILSKEESRETFHSYLKTILCEEYILFYEEYKRYKAFFPGEDSETVKIKALEIQKEFILPSGQMSLNLSANEFRRINFILQQESVTLIDLYHLYDDIYDEVIRVMNNDIKNSYFRYLTKRNSVVSSSPTPTHSTPSSPQALSSESIPTPFIFPSSPVEKHVEKPVEKHVEKHVEKPEEYEVVSSKTPCETFRYDYFSS